MNRDQVFLDKIKEILESYHTEQTAIKLVLDLCEIYIKVVKDEVTPIGEKL